MEIFEMRSGRFTSLTDVQLATLNDEQRGAYADLKSAVAKLDAANAEVEAAIAVNRAAVDALHAAQAIEVKKPKYSQLDAHRASMAQWRLDHA